MTQLNPSRPWTAIATTPAGLNRLLPFCQGTQTTLWVPHTLQTDSSLLDSSRVQIYSGSLRDHLADLWPHRQGFVFCLATGAVVRLIAPLLGHKSVDPAVVVVDETAQFAISLCGGHQGGADQLTRLVAQHLDATPVLTGAANRLRLPGIDILGDPFGWRKGTGAWTAVSAAIARSEAVQIIQDCGSPLWRDNLPPDHPFQFGFPEYPAAGEEPAIPPKGRVWISLIQRRFSPDADFPKVQWHPRVLWIGIGCERGASRSLIETAIQKVCQVHHLAIDAIAGLATIDLKSDEVGLVELSRDRRWPLRCFPAEALRNIPVPTPSEVVAAAVGTASVAEAAAILAASGRDGGDVETQHVASESEGERRKESKIQNPKSKIPNPALRVTKQIIRLPNEPGAVTVAIAQAEQEYIGRKGQIWLVGTGPGRLDQITSAAKAAIAQADAIIGYSLYIDLIRPLVRPGQIVEAMPITQERQRAQRAIDLGRWGLRVAVVSSGDCGVYGMAGLVLEQLQVQGWDGEDPEIQVFPGITALQAAASRVGAPIMHDFCAISLSDLLTPWEVIEKRLEAAAQADFVVALYNPRSKTRTKQSAIAQRIFLQYRHPETSVALVQSAYRQEENITLTTLVGCLDHPINMLTTVLIGNRTTLVHRNWMITPRGYL
ncbi:MAG: precorrin-3B C(17)-methyltransferase [Leptolyngbyaceae cyanobacterium MO_188.B28]|nr:precorrin-3B C(17)-methyltransferase [Leptolyngbyaceae cyanobacterium MO_188.B28]